MFEITKSNSKISGVVYPSAINSCRAYLCAQPIVNDVAYNNLDMGEVSLNNKVFKSFSFSLNYYYNDTTQTSYSLPYIWNISGSVNIDTQIDTCKADYPTYTGYSSLPDSISKSQGITVPINGLNKCDFFKVTLIGPSGSQFLAPKMYPGNTSNFSFVTNELSGFTTGNNGLLLITFYNDDVKFISGKNLNFRLGLSYSIVGFKVVN